MEFKKLAEYFSLLEQTTMRNKMVEILSELFHKAKNEEIDKICYLLQGRVAPLYEAIEFGMADKMMLRVISQGLKIDLEVVLSEFKKEGDLGKIAEKLKIQNENKKKIANNPVINEVYGVLLSVAKASGEGSQEEKIRMLGELIEGVDFLSARFISRIPVNKLRLGFSDMTILDALSWMLCGSKENRSEIERAYNVRPDLGFIARTVKEKGMTGLKDVNPQVGTPILMTKAERMSTGKDIIEKIGRCAIEPKYDGFRLQVHFKKDKDGIKEGFVRLFSRNLENVTKMYPDIVSGVKNQIVARDTIFEGEAIGIDINSGKYLPFQETVQRKRKYNIEAKAKEIPLKLFAFDLLFLDKKNMLTEQFSNRRKKLEQIIGKGNDIYVAKQEILDDPVKIEVIFEDAVSKGLEGVMAKKLDGIYRAGSRDFNWIKYKKSYAGKLTDTIDAVVMGYDFGQGKRTNFGIGNFLIGVMDNKKGLFETVAKIGTGLTDEEWKELKVRMQETKVKSKPEIYDVDKAMGCDVWVTPDVVVEIRADEITRSPVHTAGRVMGPSKSGAAMEVKVAGFALRFPRLEKFRKDKSANDATNLSEIEKMYASQKSG